MFVRQHTHTYIPCPSVLASTWTVSIGSSRDASWARGRFHVPRELLARQGGMGGAPPRKKSVTAWRSGHLGVQVTRRLQVSPGQQRETECQDLARLKGQPQPQEPLRSTRRRCSPRAQCGVCCVLSHSGLVNTQLLGKRAFSACPGCPRGRTGLPLVTAPQMAKAGTTGWGISLSYTAGSHPAKPQIYTYHLPPATRHVWFCSHFPQMATLRSGRPWCPRQMPLGWHEAGRTLKEACSHEGLHPGKASTGPSL